MADQCIAHGFTIAGQQLQRMYRNSGLVQHGDCLCSYQIGLLCGFGNHHIACRQCRSNLAGKNGQWKIPRADAHHHAQGAVAVIVQILLGLLGVVAQEVDGFAHFRDGVGQGLAGLPAQQSHQRLEMGLQDVCSLQQGLRTRIHGGGLPNGGGVLGLRPVRVADFRRASHAHFAQHILGGQG